MDQQKPAKPKKVGILHFLDSKRKNPVRRFCILTANKEIEYFSKDEYDPNAKVGAISGLETCKLVVYENSESDFSVSSGETTFLLQAQGDQDRRNWVLEIIKQRSIRSIIEMLDDEKLGKYAAFALANQCGGADELKVEIVREGGLDRLMRYVGVLSSSSDSSDASLVGLIYYSVSKLSLVEANRAAIGTYATKMSDLLKGDVPEYKGHALKTLVNIVSVPQVRATLFEQGIVRLVIRNLESLHVSVLPEATSVLLSLVVRGDFVGRAQNEVLQESKLICSWLDGWSGLKEKDDKLRLYSAALANMLHAITVCCRERVPEGEKMVPHVCRVLTVNKPECELWAMEFLWSILRVGNTVPQSMLENVEKLVLPLNSADKTVLTKTTLVLSKVLAQPSLLAADNLWSLINPVSVVDHFSHLDQEVRAASVQLFSILAGKPGAAAGLQRDATSFTKLGDALLADATLRRNLTASLASLSTVPEIKYALVTGSLRQGLLSSISTTKEDAEVTHQVLEVFANCTSNAGARRALADPTVLCRLLEALKSPSPDVQTRVGSVLANLSSNKHIRKELRDLRALDPVFASVMATKNRHLRLELMGAVCNMCFTGVQGGLPLSDEQIGYLISVLTSKSVKLRVCSVDILNNACLYLPNRDAMVRLGAIPGLLGLLTSGVKPEVQAHILMIVASCYERTQTDVDVAYVDLFMAVLNDVNTSRVGLRCVAYAASKSATHTKIIPHLARLFVEAAGNDYVSAEYASIAIERVLSHPDRQQLLLDTWLAHVVSLCSSTNPLVVERAASTLCSSQRVVTGMRTTVRARLAVFLDSPLPWIRSSFVRFLKDEGSSGGMTASLAQIVALLDQETLKTAQWQAKTREDGSLELSGPPIVLPMPDAGAADVVLAKLKWVDRPVLDLPCKPWKIRPVEEGPSFRLEELDALTAYFKVISPLGRQRSLDLDAVLEDFVSASLRVVPAIPSGADRSWAKAAGNLIKVENSTVTYTAQHIGGPSAVVAEGRVPYLGEFAYFEVLILKSSSDGGIAIGFVDPSKFSHARLPGWAESSFGYHGDDGNFYFGGINRSFGPTFGAGDVVGCGIDEIKGELFFTLNGRFLGVAASGVNSFNLRPSVGLVRSGESVFTNFGAQPFLWDFSFEVEQFVAAPRVQDVARTSNEALVVQRVLDPSDFAGGLWASELSVLYRRLSFVDPAVHASLQQQAKILSALRVAPPAVKSVASPPPVEK